MAKIEERVEELVTKPIDELGYKVYDVMYVKEGKDNYLRIFIDKESGISLDDCEKVNNAITDMLDEADIIKDQYFLEISSPGVERHIRKDKQLEEHIGKDINVRLFKPIDKQKELTGTLQKFDDEQVVLLINEEEITINRENISSMKRAYKW
ncbi:MAG: ribosome maturation factor RimP [Clostridia bacterium]